MNSMTKIGAIIHKTLRPMNPSVLSVGLLISIAMVAGCRSGQRVPGDKSAMRDSLCEVDSSAQKSSIDTFKVMEPEEFFTLFQTHIPPKRGEFETNEEYAKRLPQPLDTEKVFYVRMSSKIELPGHNLIQSIDHEYDVDKQVLTFYGGGLQEVRPFGYKAKKGTPVNVCDHFERLREYNAKNAFGVTRTVQEVRMTYYTFNFTNLAAIPDSIYDRKRQKFTMNAQFSPGEAKLLSESLALAVGVSVYGSDQFVKGRLETFKPTIDEPLDGEKLMYCADAKFSDLLLYDPKTKEIVRRYSLKSSAMMQN